MSTSEVLPGATVAPDRLLARLGSLLLLFPLLAVGFLVFPLAVAVGLAVLVAALVWLGYSWKHPSRAYFITFFVFIVAYARLNLGAIPVAGPSTTNRGYIALGDLLWFGMASVAMLKMVSGRFKMEGALPLWSWAMLPYLFLALVLPVIGVASGEWPMSFASPGLRHIQWVSFGLLAYWLCRECGTDHVARSLIFLLTCAGILHCAYSLIQLGYHLGFLGRSWIILDDIFSMAHGVNWFFYPRVTGLLANPNHYGLFGGFLLALGVSLSIFGGEKWFRTLVLIGTGLFAIALSGSRSAVLVSAAAVGAAGLFALRSHRTFERGAKLLVGGAFAFTALFAAAWPILPGSLQSRYVRLVGVVFTGLQADRNAAGRVTGWQDALNIQMLEYPLGTWVPGSYALQAPIDSYYVFTALQGTIAFTASWLLFMAAGSVVAWRAYSTAGGALQRAVAVSLGAWIAAILVGSVTMSPLLQPQLIAPFYASLGIAAATVRQKPQ